jgi:hypothetical protein
VLENQEDLSYLLTLVNCKLAFTNQYYHHVPCLVVLAILKILPDELKLAHYLKDVIFSKLLSDDVVTVTYEEMLLLRLSCDIA